MGVALYKVVACLTGQHDYRLVLLAAFFCIIDAAVTFEIYRYARLARGVRRTGWLFLTGAVSGLGVWATHFVAMLAFDPGIPAMYEPFVTLLSLMMSVVAASAGFTLAASESHPRPGLGGAAIGLGIGLMHFTGMQALTMPGEFIWDTGLVAASLVIGATFASVAMHLAHEARSWRGRLAATGMMTLAVCGLHFTAIAAITLNLEPVPAIAPALFDHLWMGIVIGGASLLVLLAGFGVAVIQSRSQREAIALLRLREHALRDQNTRFDAAMANMQQGLAMFDQHQRLLVSNDRYAQMYALSPEQMKPGITVREILNLRIAKGIFAGASPQDYLNVHEADLGAAASWSRIHQLTDGRTVSVAYCPMRDGGFLITHEDITEQRKAEARIAHMAHHDALTDLPNRVLLRERLETALVRVTKNEKLAVHCIDLDRFKEVNDEFGHPTGDLLLKAVAGRLLKCVGDAGTVARVGGDEFAIIQLSAGPSAAGTLAAQILESMAEPFHLGEVQVLVGASIGIAIAPDDDTDPDQLLKNADLALYRVKGESKGTLRFFEPAMNARMLERRDMERDLRSAIVQGQLELHYQPILNIESNAVSGVEALVRWRHPERGLISPATFIPLAEETGLIVPIGEWVMRTAMAQAVAWTGDLKVAVNVSPVQFRSGNLAALVATALATTGLAPHRLEIEITESVLIGDTDGTRACLLDLHRLGVRIALDDFGTGYSSLSYLRSFPFDKIKIDRCFINDLSGADPDALAIVRAVVQLGKTLGMTTTAEGIETVEQFDIVRAEGCTEIQGYLLSPPKSAKDIEAKLKLGHAFATGFAA